VVKNHKNGAILAKYPDMSKEGKSEKQDKASKLFKRHRPMQVQSFPVKKAVHAAKLRRSKRFIIL